MNTTALIIMAKRPRVGSTKTRLCPPLTFSEAAKFYEAMLLDTISMATGLDGIDLAIAITPLEATSYFEQIAPDSILVPVDCKEIGQCLSKALNHLLNMDYIKVMALNSDGPSLPTEYIQQAVDRLNDHDVVFGPSEDGGYYLIGVKEMSDQIFTDIEWSTSNVLSQSLAKCENLGLKVDLLPSWYDIDTATDIERLRKELTTLPDKALRNVRRLLKTEFEERVQEKRKQV